MWRDFVLFCCLMTSCHLFSYPLTPSYRALAKLTRLRIHVSYLLTSVLPHLELREIGYDSEQVDGILYTVLEANHILDWAPDYISSAGFLFSLLPVYYMSPPAAAASSSRPIPPPASSFPFHLYALYWKSLNKSWFLISVLRIQCGCEERGPLNSLLRVQEQKSNSHQVRWLESTNFHVLDTWPISCSADGSSSFRLNQSANVGSNAPGGKSHAASPARF